MTSLYFNRAVTACDARQGGIPWTDAAFYIAAQIFGAFVGAAAANTMFELPIFFAPQKVRTGGAQWFSEFVATCGLLAVIERLRSTALGGCRAVCRRRVYNSGLLVHGFDFFCESGGYLSTLDERYFRGNQTA